jgi:hypothetical protein
MENKYFTPDIEDFHVGYKFQLSDPTFKEWINAVFDIDDPVSNYDPLRWVAHRINLGKIRVPYLTKEQIEAEGWIEDKGLYKLRKNEDLFFTIDFNTDSYSLIINSYSKINTTYYSGDDVFKGFCKDINTFRKIIKLLGI